MAPKSLDTDVETKKKRNLGTKKKRERKKGKAYTLRIVRQTKKNILGFGHLACPEEEERWSENERERERENRREEEQAVDMWINSKASLPSDSSLSRTGPADSKHVITETTHSVTQKDLGYTSIYI